MLESVNGGVVSDRLAVAGSEDQLLYGALVLLSNTMQGVAAEFGLTFINLGWEALYFAVRRDVYFRKLFQKFL